MRKTLCISAHLIDEVNKSGKHLMGAYLLYLRAYNYGGSGLLMIDDNLFDYLVTIFGYSGKTPKKSVMRNLKKLHSSGFVRIEGDKIFLNSDDTILADVFLNRGKNSRHIKFDTGELFKFNHRQLWYQLGLYCFSGRNNKVTMSRKTVHDLVGRTPKTQQKYDKLSGIERTMNVAIIAPYKENTQLLEQLLYNAQPVFLWRDHTNIMKLGKRRVYIARRISDTISISLEGKAVSRTLSKARNLPPITSGSPSWDGIGRRVEKLHYNHLPKKAVDTDVVQKLNITKNGVGIHLYQDKTTTKLKPMVNDDYGYGISLSGRFYTCHDAKIEFQKNCKNPT